MVGEATPKSAKAGADESSAFDTPPLKIFKILFFAVQESQRLFSESARICESHPTLDIGGTGLRRLAFRLW